MKLNIYWYIWKVKEERENLLKEVNIKLIRVKYIFGLIPKFEQLSFLSLKFKYGLWNFDSNMLGQWTLDFVFNLSWDLKLVFNWYELWCVLLNELINFIIVYFLVSEWHFLLLFLSLFFCFSSTLPTVPQPFLFVHLQFNIQIDNVNQQVSLGSSLQCESASFSY